MWVERDGVNVYCADHGGEGPPLILCHANGFHGRVWDPLIPQLRERFRVLAIDLRGHGESDKPRSGYTSNNFGEDVLAVIEHLRLERPCGIGHSAGGAALVFAESIAPGTFAGLVLLDPITIPLDDVRLEGTNNPLADGARRRRRVWDTPQELFDRLRTNSPLATWKDAFLRSYVDHGLRRRNDGKFELKCPPEVEAQVFETAMSRDGWHRLVAIMTPLLILIGEHSYVWPVHHRGRTASRICSGRMEIVTGSGHFFPMEDPEQTLERTFAFLDDLDRLRSHVIGGKKGVPRRSERGD